MLATPIADSQPNSNTRPLMIIGLLFFVTGFVSWLNGPLIIFVKLAFNLDDAGALLVTTAFYLPYLVLALLRARVLRRTGMKNGMAWGLFTMAIGAVLFGEFIYERVYSGALTGLFVMGSGLSLMQTAYSPYVSILGPIDSAARRMALMGICNKIGGILAPFVFGAVAMSEIDTFARSVKAAATPAVAETMLESFAARLYWPYMVMAGLLALLAFLVAHAPLPAINPSTTNRSGEASGANTGILSFPHLWLGVLAIFFYMGVLVMAGDTIVLYGQNIGLPLDVAKHFTSYTLSAVLVGYVVGCALVPRFISQQRYLAVSAVLATLLLLGAYLSGGYVSIAFIAALGFANAMMWPAIFPLAIKGLGRSTELGSAMLVMATVGAAILPQLYALFKQLFHFQLAFLLLMLPSYLYILFYGVRGHAAGPRLRATIV